MNDNILPDLTCTESKKGGTPRICEQNGFSNEAAERDEEEFINKHKVTII